MELFIAFAVGAVLGVFTCEVMCANADEEFRLRTQMGMSYVSASRRRTEWEERARRGRICAECPRMRGLTKADAEEDAKTIAIAEKYFTNGRIDHVED